MKKIRLLLLVITLLGTVIYISCQKTASPAGPEPGSGHQMELVAATVTGRITDDAQLPVNGAAVRIGTHTTQTDVNGNFTFDNVQVDRTACLVNVEKEGFFKGMKTIVVSAGKENLAVLQLIKKTVSGTFTGSSGGTIKLAANTGSIVFEPNSIMNPANRAGYTGAVSVSAFFINPTASDFQDIMPGTLRGIDANNNVTGLKSYGMMAVELTGSNGEKLQLASGKKAVLRFPIPASLQAEAPTTIPLWSLNDTTGLWVEEGTATKVGPEYIGNVGHFSYWNCDAPFPIITFTATIKTQLNTALSGVRVVISGTGSDTSLSGYGFTNSEGLVTGMIPANRNLTMKVYDKCGTILLIKNVGPFTTAADLGTVTVTSNSSMLTISGTVVNCNAAAVTTGHVTVELEGFYYRGHITNGAFSTTIARCTNGATTARITPFDLAGNQSGTTQDIAVNGSTAATGQLAACGNALTQYINYTINGVHYYYSGEDSMVAYRALQSNTTLVSGMRDGTNATIDFTFGGDPQPGASALKFLYIRELSTIYTKASEATVNITEYGDKQTGFITGSFSGSVKDTITSNILPINVSFRVKRY